MFSLKPVQSPGLGVMFHSLFRMIQQGHILLSSEHESGHFVLLKLWAMYLSRSNNFLGGCFGSGSS